MGFNIPGVLAHDRHDVYTAAADDSNKTMID
jgi:hypothetical protein